MAEAPFLQAAFGRPPSQTPVWFMRQAGRSLPEYRALRGEGSILEAVKKPDLTVELTLQPVRRYGVDAAILFSDIVVPAHAVGFGIDVTPGTGPMCALPLRTRADLDRLRPFVADIDAPFVGEAVSGLIAELPDEVPLLAFAGAPFTVASYLIEGRPTRDYTHTMTMMRHDEALWHDVMERLVQYAVESIGSQLRHGARAFQLFDSWAGALTADEYQAHVLPYSAKVFSALRAEFPRAPGIHFGVGCDHLLGHMHAAGATILGLDWRTSITQARQRMGEDLVVQGNLDPALVVAGRESALAGTRAVLDDNGGNPRHIFNLGHGVPPHSDPDVLAAIVDLVHRG